MKIFFFNVDSPLFKIHVHSLHKAKYMLKYGDCGDIISSKHAFLSNTKVATMFHIFLATLLQIEAIQLMCLQH